VPAETHGIDSLSRKFDCWVGLLSCDPPPYVTTLDFAAGQVKGSIALGERVSEIGFNRRIIGCPHLPPGWFRGIIVDQHMLVVLFRHYFDIHAENKAVQRRFVIDALVDSP